MNLTVILREEILCLITLIFLLFTSRSYRLGKDGRPFSRLITYATLHIIFDIVTVVTVNNQEFIAPWVNKTVHVIFYITAILFSIEIFNYVIKACYPRLKQVFYNLGIALCAIYLAVIPFLKIEYIDTGRGTWSSSGTAAYVGYAIAFLLFFTALILCIINFKKMSRSFKIALFPMLLILLIADSLQIFFKEILFTGGAITIVTVGFFFSLENPVHVLERKVMTDALTGVRSRHSYEEDLRSSEEKFRKDNSLKYTFVFCDINALKRVNDRFGHDEGDRYISLVASALGRKLKNAKKLYRIGGDEFLAAYENTDNEIVVSEINSLQSSVKDAGRNKSYETSVAVGYASTNENSKSLLDVIKMADYSMYRNKNKMKASSSGYGEVTRLNVSGLTDRVFDAMCSSNDLSYPYITNLDTGVTRISRSWMEFFRLEDEFYADFNSVWINYIHPNDRDKFLNDIRDTFEGRKKYHDCTYRALAPNGKYVKCTCHGAIYKGMNGENDMFSGYVINHGTDILIDPVTGLGSFSALSNEVEEIIENKSSAFVLKLSLNNFSRINMLFGYDESRSVSARIAETLESLMRNENRVFSKDGEYFSILLKNETKEYVSELYDNITEVLSVKGILNDLTNSLITFDISAGAIEIQQDEYYDTQYYRSCLIYALEESTHREGGKLVFFDISKQSRQADFNLVSNIHLDAITSKGGFYMRYQPIFDTESGKVVSAEALLRWKDENNEEVLPMRFIEFLEKDPAYYSLGLHIIELSVKDAIEIKKIIPGFKVSVNITSAQIKTPSFTDDVLKIMKKYSYPVDSLILEITDRFKIVNTNAIKDGIEKLKEAGFLIAFDDLGGGYTTVDMLMNIGVDEIKLDRKFVSTLSEKNSYKIFVNALVQGSDERNYMICFEGVETEETAEYLKQFGPSLSQGYYYSKPLLIEDFISYINKEKEEA